MSENRGLLVLGMFIFFTMYRDFIHEQLQKASDLARSYFGKVTDEIKQTDSSQVVTKADREIGQMIIAAIKKQFPDHNTIDEEAGGTDKHSLFTWVIDPIDGTSNYALSLPFYGCMVGLLHDGKPIAGGIALPYFQEIYTAEKGKGTIGPNEPLRVTSQTDLSQMLLAYATDKHPDVTTQQEEVKIFGRIVQEVRNIRATNSVYDSIQVANGKYSAFLNHSSKIWDNVGQQCIIEEAGGMYTDLYGKPIDYSDPMQKLEQNFTFCAAAPQIHEQLQEIIHGRNKDNGI